MVAAPKDWNGMGCLRNEVWFCRWVGFDVDDGDGDGGVVVGSSTYRWGWGEGWGDLCLRL